MRILIAYATAEGQTRKVAEFLKERFDRLGHETAMANLAENPPDPAGFDAAVVAASVHRGNYESTAVAFVAANRAALSRMHSAFVSVSLAAITAESAASLRQWVAAFLQKTGWPAPRVEHVAGALLYSHYNFVTRWIMRMIARKAGLNTNTSRDYEYTDWIALGRFADSFAAGAPAPARRPVSSLAG